MYRKKRGDVGDKGRERDIKEKDQGRRCKQDKKNRDMKDTDTEKDRTAPFMLRII